MLYSWFAKVAALLVHAHLKLQPSSLLNRRIRLLPPKSSPIQEIWVRCKKGIQEKFIYQTPGPEKALLQSADTYRSKHRLEALLVFYVLWTENGKCNDQKALTKICGTPFFTLPSHHTLRQLSLPGSLGGMKGGEGKVIQRRVKTESTEIFDMVENTRGGLL